MSFVRRSFPPALKPHECPLPRWRWLPLLVWPRWREGARWRCGYVLEYRGNGVPSLVSGGCGKLFEWRLSRTEPGTYRWVPVAEEKCYE